MGSWGDWLGTGRIAPKDIVTMTHDEAQKFARSLKLKSRTEWISYHSQNVLPEGMPVAPWQAYKNQGFVDSSDFFGFEYVHASKRQYLPYEEAEAFVQKLDLKNLKQWQAYCSSGKKPSFIHGNPAKQYKGKGWINLGKWLGTNRQAARDIQFRKWNKARKFARSLGFGTIEEWQKFSASSDRPSDIPSSPSVVYAKNGWLGWDDGLDKPKRPGKKRKNWRPFREARAFCRNLGINSVKWREYVKSDEKPDDIPGNPDQVYKGKGWVSWSDWLGTKKK